MIAASVASEIARPHPANDAAMRYGRYWVFLEGAITFVGTPSAPHQMGIAIAHRRSAAIARKARKQAQKCLIEFHLTSFAIKILRGWKGLVFEFSKT